jgi:hypothetical protein
VVLVPQPSEDVNDPLRWPTWKKYFAFLNVCLLAFMTTGFISGFSPGLYLLSVEFKRDVSTTTGLILWPLLTSGLGVRATFPFRQIDSLITSKEFLLGPNSRVRRQTTRLRTCVAVAVLLHHLVCSLTEF